MPVLDKLSNNFSPFPDFMEKPVLDHFHTKLIHLSISTNFRAAYFQSNVRPDFRALLHTNFRVLLKFGLV